MLRRLTCDGGASEVKSDRKAETPTNEETSLETRVEGARVDYYKKTLSWGLRAGRWRHLIWRVRGDGHHL